MDIELREIVIRKTSTTLFSTTNPSSYRRTRSKATRHKRLIRDDVCLKGKGRAKNFVLRFHYH